MIWIWWQENITVVRFRVPARQTNETNFLMQNGDFGFDGLGHGKRVGGLYARRHWQPDQTLRVR